MQVNIPKRLVALIVVLLVVGTAATAIFTHPEWMQSLFSKETPAPPSPLEDPSAQAVVAGVQSFYTIDYTVPQTIWEAQVCAVTTLDGCDVIKTLYAPAVYTAAKANKVQTGRTATAIRMVEESKDGKTRVWSLDVTLTQPWQGVQSPMQLYADVVLGDDGNWRMNHILLDQEVERYKTPAPSIVETPSP